MIGLEARVEEFKLIVTFEFVSSQVDHLLVALKRGESKDAQAIDVYIVECDVLLNSELDLHDFVLRKGVALDEVE